MIGHEFNRLDDAFITVWSRFLIDKNEAKAKTKIQYLARLGQINAVQNWYLLKDENEQDAKINSRVAGYNGDNYEELIALSNFYFDAEKQQNEKYLNQLKDLRRKIYSVVSTCIELTSYIEEYEKTKNEYFTTKTMQLKKTAMTILKNSKNPLHLETLLELREFDDFYSNIKKIYKIKVGASLKRLYKQHPNNPSIKFAYAKNLLFFGDQKARCKATSLLKELGRRNISEILTKKQASLHN